MNILITTGIYPPDVGGPARFVPLIAEKLSKKNNVKVITLSQDMSNLDKDDYQIIRILRKQNKIYFFEGVLNDPFFLYIYINAIKTRRTTNSTISCNAINRRRLYNRCK